MKCPVCTETQLIMNERQGIEIDYCPQCRGMWLDRGELDKMIERSHRERAFTSSSSASAADLPRPENCDDIHGFGRSSHQQGKRSFLKDLFD